MAKTADAFVAAVKRKITLPTGNVLLDDTDILAIADEVTAGVIVPLVLTLRQEYFGYFESETVTVGTASYSVPYRAIGRALRDLKFANADATQIRSLALSSLEDAHLYLSDTAVHSFYFIGDKVVLLGTPATASEAIYWYYNMRPSSLVLLASAGTITAVASNVISISATPAAFVLGASCDFIRGKSGNNIMAYDKAITNVAGTSITFTLADVPSGLAVGDYLALAGQTPVIQLPDDVYQYFVLLTSRDVLVAIGDTEGLQLLEKPLKEAEKGVTNTMQPRIQGEPTKVINRMGLLRSSRTRLRMFMR